MQFNLDNSFPHNTVAKCCHALYAQPSLTKRQKQVLVESHIKHWKHIFASAEDLPSNVHEIRSIMVITPQVERKNNKVMKAMKC